jgi:hypothetical protein
LLAEYQSANPQAIKNFVTKQNSNREASFKMSSSKNIKLGHKTFYQIPKKVKGGAAPSSGLDSHANSSQAAFTTNLATT